MSSNTTKFTLALLLLAIGMFAGITYSKNTTNDKLADVENLSGQSSEVEIKKIDPKTFYDDFQENPDKYSLIDIRGEENYFTEHPEGSILVPLKMTLTSNLPKDKTIVVFCEKEESELVAYHTLINSGYSDVYIIEGASPAWKAAGLPLVVGEEWQIETSAELKSLRDLLRESSN